MGHVHDEITWGMLFASNIALIGEIRKRLALSQKHGGQARIIKDLR